jgi:hypothetical protein
MVHSISLSKEEYLLKKLKYFLNYELSSSSLFFISFVYASTFVLAIIAAVVFTPFLIYVLYKNRKYLWLILFFVLIVFPPLIIYLINLKEMFLSIVLYVELGLFYFYCVVLRFVVADWMEDVKARAFRKMCEAEKEQNKKLFEQQFGSSGN